MWSGTNRESEDATNANVSQHSKTQEEAEVCVNAINAEDAAAKAPSTDLQWLGGTETSGAFVRGVEAEEKISLRTRLRIEEHQRNRSS